MDRFAEMEAFVRVVEAGGFTEAGRRARISKSAISKQVAALEERLGARLLDRTTRRVRPTEIGMAYYERAVRAIAEADEADAEAASLQGAPRGELRISAPLSFGRRILAPVVSDFLMEHPQIHIDLSLDDRFVDLIAEGFELAIRIGDLEDSMLKARRIGQTEILLVASPAYLEKHGEPTRVEDLADHQLLHYSNSSTGRSWVLNDAAGEPHIIRVNGALTVNNGDAILDAVEGGLGVAHLPDFICGESLARGAVKQILPDLAFRSLGVSALTPPGRYQQPKVKVFVDYLKRRLAERGCD